MQIKNIKISDIVNNDRTSLSPKDYLNKEIDIKKCPRCSESHKKISFKKFKINDVKNHQSWGICPQTNEPILIGEIEGDT